MNEFKFTCPGCGQKIACDPSHAGAQISCPACQKVLTVPAPEPVATAPMPVPGAATPAVPVHASARPPEPERPVVQTSGLAVAALVCSLFLSVGCIPGIVCGHLARRQIRRNLFLTGTRMATAGLALSYFFLLSTVAVVAYGSYAIGPIEGKQLSAKEAEAKPPAELAARRTDEVIIADADSEAAHGMKWGGYSYKGEFNGRKLRDAHPGAFFSYSMKVDPIRPMALRCTYWGSDSDPGRLFDILVNDEVVGTQKLDFNDPGHFFDVEYKIPTKLTQGQSEVKVEFRPRPGKYAGGVFGCQMLRR